MIGAANPALEEMRPPEAFMFSLHQPDHLILVAGNELTHSRRNTARESRAHGGITVAIATSSRNACAMPPMAKPPQIIAIAIA